MLRVSANTKGRIRNPVRQEGNLVQHDLVASVGSNFEYLTPNLVILGIFTNSATLIKSLLVTTFTVKLME